MHTFQLSPPDQLIKEINFSQIYLAVFFLFWDRWLLGQESQYFFLQSSISGILINILIGRRFILAMSGLALSSHSALIPHLLTWPTTTKRPSPALLLPDLLLNRAVEKYSYLTTSMATSYLLLLTRRPAHLINLLNSSNLYIIYALYSRVILLQFHMFT